MIQPAGTGDYRQLVETLKVWRPYIALVAAVVLLAVVVPGTRDAEDSTTLTGGAGVTGGTTPIATEAGGAAGAADAAGATVAANGSGLASAGGSATAGGRQAAVRTGGGSSRSAPGVAPPPALAFNQGDPMAAPDCDASTGRIKIPSFYAPNCVPMWPKGADNGGNTWQGVFKDKIVVAAYVAQENEQTEAILTAAGAGDDTTEEEDDANRLKMVEAFLAHYETYGRKVEVVKVKGTGESDDDAAARSDAVRVATEIKAFASWGAPSSVAYIDELVARGVLCLSCSASMPQEKYEGWAPYVWGTLMASTQGYVHRAEYVGKRLWGKPAKYAGDVAFKAQARKLGIVYYEDEAGSYKSGVDFFETELARYGAFLTDRISYILDLNKAAEDARTIIARLKDKGVTSVIFAGDPLFPIFLTKSATEQNYFPEWIITGSALTDTTLFARTYDPAQWRNAFGISYLVARVDPKVVDAEGNLFSWHYGQHLKSEPHELPMGAFFAGVHLAGPNLNPQTFRDGLFALQRTSGFLTRYAVSYGTGLWRTGPDYLALDDATEIWWDPQAQGPDELDNNGVGMYRYVDMGVRYLPDTWPATDVRPFDTANTITFYPERPAQDKMPEYPRREGMRKP